MNEQKLIQNVIEQIKEAQLKLGGGERSDQTLFSYGVYECHPGDQLYR